MDGRKKKSPEVGPPAESAKKLQQMELAKHKRQQKQTHTRLQTGEKASKALGRVRQSSVQGKTTAQEGFFSDFAGHLDQAGEMGTKLGLALTQSMNTFGQAGKAGALSASQGFEDLGKVMLKGALQAIGQNLLQLAAQDLVKAGILLVSVVGEALAPGYFAAGAIEAAAGGVFMGMATAALAEGGIVTKPTLAWLGEDGKPELVLPLDKVQSFQTGLSVQATQFQAHFPDVQNTKVAQDPGFAKAFQQSLQSAMELAAGSTE